MTSPQTVRAGRFDVPEVFVYAALLVLALVPQLVLHRTLPVIITNGPVWHFDLRLRFPENLYVRPLTAFRASSG